MSTPSTAASDYFTGKKRELPDYTASIFEFESAPPSKRLFKQSDIVKKMAVTQKKTTTKTFVKKAGNFKKKITKNRKFKLSHPRFARYALDYVWCGRIDANDGTDQNPTTANPGSLIPRLAFNTMSYGFVGNYQEVVIPGEVINSSWNLILTNEGKTPATGSAKMYSMTTAYSQFPPMDVAIRDLFKKGRCIGVSYSLQVINNATNTNVDLIIMHTNSSLVPGQVQLQNPLVWSRMCNEKYTVERSLTGPNGSKNSCIVKGYINNPKIRGRTRSQFVAEDDNSFALPNDLTQRVSPKNDNFFYCWIRATDEAGNVVRPEVKYSLKMRFMYEFYDHRAFTV